MGLRLLAAALFFVSIFAWGPARAVEVPRVVLGLYDGALYPYRFSQIHQMAEMPLNHLGLVVRPHDVREPLPPIESMPEVRGILTAFTDDAAFADPEAYLAWLERASQLGKRVVVLNFNGVERARDGRLGQRSMLGASGRGAARTRLSHGVHGTRGFVRRARPTRDRPACARRGARHLHQ
jgi:hypothetical protein